MGRLDAARGTNDRDLTGHEHGEVPGFRMLSEMWKGGEMFNSTLGAKSGAQYTRERGGVFFEWGNC